MTIVMIGQKGLPAKSGGIERHAECLASGLASRGHRVIAYGRKWYVGNERCGGVEQRFTSGFHTKHLDAISHGITALWDARRLRPDIVHLHGPSIGLIAPLARLLHPKAKLVMTFHCVDRAQAKWNRLAKWILGIGEWMTCHLADRTIVVSQELSRYCLKTYRCQTTFATHPFSFMSKPSEDFARKNGLEPNQYLLFVARLIPNKNAHVLIEAYRRACDRHPVLMRSVPLVIVGGGSWTDKYVNNLREQAAKIPGVLMLGEKTGEELRSLQAHALAHVFPTSSEGMAFSMIEAGAFGRAAVMTDLPQNKEALGTGALAVPVQDAEALTNGLLEIVSMPQTERTRRGDAMKRHVEERFDFVERVKDIERVYHELTVMSTSSCVAGGLGE